MPNAGGAPATLDATIDQQVGRHWIGGRAARPSAEGASTLHLDDEAEPTPPQPPPASLVLMAPTGDQALAMVGMDLYVVTVPQVGATPPTVSVATPASASVPVRKLNEVGGGFPCGRAPAAPSAGR